MRAEEQNCFLRRQAKMRARTIAIRRFEKREIEPVRDHLDAAPGKQAALSGNLGQPMARRNNHRSDLFIDPLFALPDNVGEITDFVAIKCGHVPQCRW